MRGALRDRAYDPLICQPIRKSRRDAFPGNHRPNELGKRMHKAVLVADDMPARPPSPDVGMTAFRDQDIAKTTPAIRVLRVIEF